MSSKQLLKQFSYYKTGGTCEVLFSPSSVEELAENMREVDKRKLPFFLLGGGTNSLVMDEHWPGAVIIFNKLNKLEFSGTVAKVQAGVDNSLFAKACLERKLKGVAWMYRLPGQLGGTVRMNARCYGGEISQVVSKVRAVTPKGEISEYRDKSIFRGYKDTIFMTNGEIIGEVEIQLAPGETKEIEEKMKFCESDRESKGQFKFPTCGCVFKNDYDVGVPSGMLLEASGVKQFKHKGSEINPYHANFVYNVSADARAILEMSLKMREAVFEKFGVWLEYEMEILGNLPDDLREKILAKKKPAYKAKELKPLLDTFKVKLKTLPY